MTISLIANVTNGTGSYEYYDKSGIIVHKKAVWDTVSQYGKEWRIVVAEEQK